MRNHVQCLDVDLVFQYYFGYTSSLYPHNIFLESLIVFGILFVSYFSLSFIGLFYYYKSIRKLVIYFIYFFNLIIISKRVLFNDWFFYNSSYLISISLTTLADESRILNLKNTQLNDKHQGKRILILNHYATRPNDAVDQGTILLQGD